MYVYIYVIESHCYDGENRIDSTPWSGEQHVVFIAQASPVTSLWWAVLGLSVTVRVVGGNCCLLLLHKLNCVAFKDLPSHHHLLFLCGNGGLFLQSAFNTL